MSAWRLAVKSLHALGGKASTNSVYLHGASGRALHFAKRMGLVAHDGNWRGRGKVCLWSLTPRGVDFCEGRIVIRPAERFGMRGRPRLVICATWLQSLPQDIRIEQREPA